MLIETMRVVNTIVPILQMRTLTEPRAHSRHRAELCFRLRLSWFRVQPPECYFILFFKGVRNGIS